MSRFFSSLTLLVLTLLFFSSYAIVATPEKSTNAPIKISKAKQEAPKTNKKIPTPVKRPNLDPKALLKDLAPVVTANEKVILVKALDLLDKNQIKQALKLKKQLKVNSLADATLSWVILRNHYNKVDFNTFSQLQASSSLWTKTNQFNRIKEILFINENKVPDNILKYFSAHAPSTKEGVILFAQVLALKGEKNYTKEVIIPWWTDTLLSPLEEEILINSVGKLLTSEQALRHLKISLYAYHIKSAALHVEKAKAHSLFNAFKAIAQKQPNKVELLNAVNPMWHKDPIYAYMKFELARQQNNKVKAGKIILETVKKHSTQELIFPQLWAKERMLLARELLKSKNYQLAYDLLTVHHGEGLALILEQEFLAGWQALRSLNQPTKAKKHFTYIVQNSADPEIKSRAYYWLGQTELALKNASEAHSSFKKAAIYFNNFYGQLAATHLNAQEQKEAMQSSKITSSNFSNLSNLTKDNTFKAIRLLHELGRDDDALPLYSKLIYKLKNATDFLLLKQVALENSSHTAILRIGDNAYNRRLPVGFMAHPIGSLNKKFNNKQYDTSLLYAISKQESHFQPTAISSAGAIGLFQLLPSTAQATAKKLNINYDKNALTNNPEYNTELGAYYINQLLNKFDGSYILALISYNAGPIRAQQWIDRYGDPRKKNINDIIDWIEKIPFPETRNYVKKVLANYNIYKHQLTGNSNMLNILQTNKIVK